MNIKYWEEEAKKRGLTLLIEKYQLSVEPSQIEVLDAPKLIESNGEKYKARAIIKNVKTSKFTENLNGRIYTRELDERLIKENLPEGTLSLADHPKDDDGSILNICGVWHNARLDENFSYGDWYLVGDAGSLIKETIDAGGRIGVSRVGFGEFLEDGKTVNSETYSLERYGDAVINPSQQVFATYENISENISTLSIEETSKKDDIIKEVITNKIDNKEQNNKGNEVFSMEDKRFMELNHKNHINEAIRKAKSNENLKEAIETLAAIETDSKDLKEKVKVEVETLQIKLNEQRVNAEQALEEKSTAYTELEEKYNTATKVVDELKSQVDRAKKIQEILDIKDEVDLDEMKEYVEKTREDYSTLTENISLMKEDIDAVSAIFEEDGFKDLEIGNIQDVRDMVEDTQLRTEDLDYLKNLVKEGQEAIDERETELEKLGYVFDEADDKDDDKKENPFAKKDDKKDDDKDDEEDKDDDKKDDKKDEKKEAVEDKEEEEKKTDIEVFVEREIVRNPSLKDIEDELVKSISLNEAIEKISLFTEKSEEVVVKFKESVTKRDNSKIEPYKFKR